MLNYLMRLPPGRMGEGASMNQMALDLCHPREGDFDGGMLEECRVGLQVLEGCNLVSGSSSVLHSLAISCGASNF